VAVIPRAEMLAELMRLKYGIAVAGSHGKTTTTSLIASILAQAGLDPTFVVGGRLNQAGSNARLGKSEWIVVEADESDRSFLLLSPVIALVTNIDYEHMDCYADLADLQEAFVQFINKVPFYGAAILGVDDPRVGAIVPRVHRRVVTYGLESEADWMAHTIRTGGWKNTFHVRVRSGRDEAREWGEFHLPLAGRHNVANALAAMAAARELGVAVEPMRRALKKFSGVHRRFEVRLEAKDVTLIDDYGHHPAEIRQTLSAARGCRFRRLVVLFQPHRYTRTRYCWNEFLRCFEQADVLVLTEIYPASEAPLPGITGRALAEAIAAAGHAHVEFHADLDTAVEAVLRQVQPGDALLTVGAGSISKAADELAERLPAVLGVVPSKQELANAD
jgi:UDP-N-acetylmuramate--alanine ligase